MTNRTRLAMVLGGLLLGAAAGSASASIATPEFRAVAPVTIQLARHGHGRDDVGCDDHGTDLCAIQGGGEQVARHDGRDDDHGDRRGRGDDDVGCDDHGTDLCAAGDRSLAS
jgi:hypothetical protein